MGYRIREIDAEIKFCQALDLGAISQMLTKRMVLASLEAEQAVTRRVRKLDLAVTVLVIVLMNIYTNLSLRHVLQKLACGLRFIWWNPDYELPGANALSYRRYQLGARVLVDLFRRLCRPLSVQKPQAPFCSACG